MAAMIYEHIATVNTLYNQSYSTIATLLISVFMFTTRLKRILFMLQ